MRRAGFWSSPPRVACSRRPQVRRSQSSPSRWGSAYQHQGRFPLEQMRVSRWNGDPPAPATPSLRASSGRTGRGVEGEITGCDSAAKSFLVRQNGRGRRDAHPRRRHRVRLPRPRERGTPLASPRRHAQDGARGSAGAWSRSRAWPSGSRPRARRDAPAPVARLRSLNVQTPKDPPTLEPELMGTLELEGVYLRGVCELRGWARRAGLARARKTASPLRRTFRAGSSTAGPRLRRGGRRSRRRHHRLLGGGCFRFCSGAAGQPATPGPRRTRRCAALAPPADRRRHPMRRDEDRRDGGVFFKSLLSDSTFVPHAKVKCRSCCCRTVGARSY